MGYPILDYNEIKDGDHFEELVAAYFRKLKKDDKSGIINVAVKPPAIGTDGGRDILVDILVTDGITEFKRRWVIQCKFHNKSISTDKLSDINIPSLIHSWKACGYLLICRNSPTTKLTTLFERLNEECKFKYKYEVWSGSVFKNYILQADTTIHQSFFPKYYSELKQLEK